MTRAGVTTGTGVTKLLASVTNLQEALWVLEAGADIIDLKNPAEGALGALPLDLIKKIVVAIGGRQVVSATIGDLPMDPVQIASATERVAATGVDIVKIGFFGPSCSGDFSHRDCIQALKPLATGGLRMVAVLMADQQPNFEILPNIKAAGFFGVMLDTANKNGSSLLDYLSYEDLKCFVDYAASLKLESGLAGSLRFTQVEELNFLSPSYLGFRGALCLDGKRSLEVDKMKVIELKNLLCEYNRFILNQA